MCRLKLLAKTNRFTEQCQSVLKCFRMETGEEPLVKTAASVFRNLCYNNRDSLSAGILVAGWDKQEGGQVGFYSS